jgi:hypothetical protein
MSIIIKIHADKFLTWEKSYYWVVVVTEDGVLGRAAVMEHLQANMKRLNFMMAEKPTGKRCVESGWKCKYYNC